MSIPAYGYHQKAIAALGQTVSTACSIYMYLLATLKGKVMVNVKPASLHIGTGSKQAPRHAEFAVPHPKADLHERLRPLRNS